MLLSAVPVKWQQSTLYAAGTDDLQAACAASHLLNWLRSLCVVPVLRRQAGTAMLQSQLSE